MEKLTVEITERHIKKGKVGDHFQCPIALAIRSLGILGVNVSAFGSAYFTVKGAHYTVKLPKKAQTFINKFDSGKPVKPFSFIARPKAA